MINEMQAYLIHTPDPRVLRARARSASRPARLAEIRPRVRLAGMPPGWLRDETPGALPLRTTAAAQARATARRGARARFRPPEPLAATAAAGAAAGRPIGRLNVPQVGVGLLAVGPRPGEQRGGGDHHDDQVGAERRSRDCQPAKSGRFCPSSARAPAAKVRVRRTRGRAPACEHGAVVLQEGDPQAPAEARHGRRRSAMTSSSCSGAGPASSVQRSHARRAAAPGPARGSTARPTVLTRQLAAGAPASDRVWRSATSGPSAPTSPVTPTSPAAETPALASVQRSGGSVAFTAATICAGVEAAMGPESPPALGPGVVSGGASGLVASPLGCPSQARRHPALRTRGRAVRAARLRFRRQAPRPQAAATGSGVDRVRVDRIGHRRRLVHGRRRRVRRSGSGGRPRRPGVWRGAAAGSHRQRRPRAAAAGRTPPPGPDTTRHPPHGIRDGPGGRRRDRRRDRRRGRPARRRLAGWRGGHDRRVSTTASPGASAMPCRNASANAAAVGEAVLRPARHGARHHRVQPRRRRHRQLRRARRRGGDRLVHDGGHACPRTGARRSAADTAARRTSRCRCGGPQPAP